MARSKSLGFSEASATRAASRKRSYCSGSLSGRFVCGLRGMLEPTRRAKTANFSDVINRVSQCLIGPQKFRGIHTRILQRDSNRIGKAWEFCVKAQQLVSILAGNNGLSHDHL